jgi:hypothetical protein
VEWNKLFFSSIRYVLSEQLTVDWVLKTSFVRAKHNYVKLHQSLTFKNDKSNNTEYKKHKNIFYDIYEIINECFSNFNFMSKYYYILDDTFNKKILEIYKTNSITINDEFLFKPSEQLGGTKQVNYRNRNKKNTIKKKIKIKRLTKKL